MGPRRDRRLRPMGASVDRVTGPAPRPGAPGRPTVVEGELDWMPAARYSGAWRSMPAFALPSFFDGRVRVTCGPRTPRNRRPIELLGHARRDRVTPVGVHRPRHRRADPRRGTPARRRAEHRSPRSRIERGRPAGRVERCRRTAPPGPRRHRSGAVPAYRRPHRGNRVARGPRSRGPRLACDEASSFDVVPTIFDLLGQGPVPGIAGRSLLAEGTAPVR